MDLSARVIYRTDDFLLLNKPPGVGVHSDEGEAGLVVQLSEALDQPLWLVHRLDKMTSGLLLLATSKAAAAELSRAFEARSVDKLYLALSEHKPRRKQGRIRGDMERGRSGNWLLRRTLENPATTEFITKAAAPGRRLILCHPTTGKTHQIRVALKSEGVPILGDTRYAGAQSSADRGYLHAWQLGFEYAGQVYAFRCDPTEGDGFLEHSTRDAIDEISSGWPEHWHLPYLMSEKAERIDV